MAEQRNRNPQVVRSSRIAGSRIFWIPLSVAFFLVFFPFPLRLPVLTGFFLWTGSVGESSDSIMREVLRLYYLPRSGSLGTQASLRRKAGSVGEPVRENASDMRIQDLAMAEEHPIHSVMLPGNTPGRRNRYPGKSPEGPAHPG